MKFHDSYFAGTRTPPEKALQKLKHFCGYQERNHSEVKQKLYSLGLSKKDVEELISRLIEEGYLNEERYALHFAAGKSRIKGWGKQKIRHELGQKGVSEFCIVKALKSLDENEYAAGFNRVAEKKWKLLQLEKNIFVKKNKWLQYLLRRGFEPAIINTWVFPEDSEPGTASE